MRNSARLILLPLALTVLFIPTVHAIEVNEDHQEMTGPFADGPSVTAACLECHDDVAHDFMKTSHWNWAPMQTMGNQRIPLGKKNLINNFCIAVSSNWARCTSCHAGYGWKNAEFDFTDPENPQMVARYEVTEYGTHNMWVEDDVLYQAYYEGGMRLVDVSGELMGNLYTQGREISVYKANDPLGWIPNAPAA